MPYSTQPSATLSGLASPFRSDSRSRNTSDRVSLRWASSTARNGAPWADASSSEAGSPASIWPSSHESADRLRWAGERKRLAPAPDRGRQQIAPVRYQNEYGVTGGLFQCLEERVGGWPSHRFRRRHGDQLAGSPARGQRQALVDLPDLVDTDQLLVQRRFDRLQIGMEPGRGKMAGPAIVAGAFHRRRSTQQRSGEPARKAPFTDACRSPQEQRVRNSSAGFRRLQPLPLLVVPGKPIVHSMM